jgi:hypothetical protein
MFDTLEPREKARLALHHGVDSIAKCRALFVLPGDEFVRHKSDKKVLEAMKL